MYIFSDQDSTSEDPSTGPEVSQSAAQMTSEDESADEINREPRQTKAGEIALLIHIVDNTMKSMESLIILFN